MKLFSFDLETMETQFKSSTVFLQRLCCYNDVMIQLRSFIHYMACVMATEDSQCIHLEMHFYLLDEEYHFLPLEEKIQKFAPKSWRTGTTEVHFV